MVLINLNNNPKYSDHTHQKGQRFKPNCIAIMFRFPNKIQAIYIQTREWVNYLPLMTDVMDCICMPKWSKESEPLTSINPPKIFTLWNPFHVVLSAAFSSLNTAAIFSFVATTVDVDLNNIISYQSYKKIIKEPPA